MERFPAFVFEAGEKIDVNAMVGDAERIFRGA
ncbi:hypothetical protein X734_03900 [Mesorhizobium sp. L2C084A000]|nr:hypothetical protein X734_03900 [Mesorhizobium sp. L2C084A000]